MRQPDVLGLDSPLVLEVGLGSDEDLPPQVLTEPDMPAAADGALRRGVQVEVRCRFDGRWSPGFVVDVVDHEGAWLRRLSDGSLIPVPFGPTDLRNVTGGC